MAYFLFYRLGSPGKFDNYLFRDMDSVKSFIQARKEEDPSFKVIRCINGQEVRLDVSCQVVVKEVGASDLVDFAGKNEA